MIEPRPGDLVRMVSFAHVEPNVTWSFRVPGKKKVAVFMLLGEENKDGSEPLDGEKILNQLGWVRA